jgi:HlyD family secretion protein
VAASPDNIYRGAALERLSSPEHLDQLIDVTRPTDWIGAVVIAVCLIAVLIWSVIGKIPTRVAGEGILVSNAGRVVDAVSAVGGRLAAVDVEVGDHVKQGQPIAHVVQTEVEQRYRDAAEVVKEREHEHSELAAAIKRELDIKAGNVAAQKAGLEQVVAAAQKRVAYLVGEVAGLEGLNAKGFITRRELEDRRMELSSTQQRITESQNEMQRLEGQMREAESQRQLEALASQFKVNDARRQMQELAGLLERNSRLLSPMDGKVLEIKVSAGGVLSAGTPVVSIETDGSSLEAIVYLPADRGKNVQPGMEVRVEPSTVKREEFGTMIGTVVTASAFPVTPEGMAAVLHNDALVKRFSETGAPYAILVRFQPDDGAFSGYHWSSGNGPPIRLSTGTLLHAEVTTRELPPIDLIVPLARRLSGIGS